MTVPYEIITIPHPTLKQTASPVETITDDIHRQIERMMVTLEEAGGIGLAANQVDIANRICIVDVPEGIWQWGPEKDGLKTIERGPEADGETKDPLFMINPEIIWESQEKSVYEEGCLSIPGQYAHVIRPAHIKVRFLDKNGKIQEIDSHGLHSHCVQHEIDHLNGTLFIDHLSSLKRNMIMKKFKKNQK